ncbi:MAG: putative phage abortive infection protein [Bacteroidetes bacterium]|nr:putative phage abortive infection protein [Bacteroidota bacterium]
MTTPDSISDYPWTRIFLGVVVCVVLFIAANYVLGVWLFTAPTAADGFGDVFGLSNALFSGLALAAVIITLFMQRLELKLQRLELTATREELKGQKEQMEIQNATLARQEFENGFFNLLSLRHELINNFSFGYDHSSTRPQVRSDQQQRPTEHRTATGRSALDQITGFLVYHMKHLGAGEERVEASYLEFYDGFESTLGPYFRSLYHLLNYVDISDLDDERKRYFVSIVRSQLSRNELLLLYYNSMSVLGRKGMRRLVGKYNVLKYLPVSSIPNEKHRALLDEATYRPQVLDEEG